MCVCFNHVFNRRQHPCGQIKSIAHVETMPHWFSICSTSAFEFGGAPFNHVERKLALCSPDLVSRSGQPQKKSQHLETR